MQAGWMLSIHFTSSLIIDDTLVLCYECTVTQLDHWFKTSI